MYQRIMSDMLAHIPGVVVYIDDVLVTGSTQEEHDRLHKVIDTIYNMGLCLNREKSWLSRTEVQFLGHTFNKDGLQANSAKIEATVNMPVPTSKVGC